MTLIRPIPNNSFFEGKVLVTDGTTGTATVSDIATGITYSGSIFGCVLVSNGTYTVSRASGTGGFTIWHTDGTTTYANSPTQITKGEIVVFTNYASIQLS